MARTCKLIFIVLDVLKPLGDKAIIEKELEGMVNEFVDEQCLQKCIGLGIRYVQFIQIDVQSNLPLPCLSGEDKIARQIE